MQRRPTPTQQETIEDLLTRSKRRELPIRWSFVQRGSRLRPEPGPLAQFVSHHEGRALDLYLLLQAVASAAPWNVDLPAGVWARMLGLPGDNGPLAVSKIWKRLEDRGLIARDRVRRHASVTLLCEDCTGDPPRLQVRTSSLPEAALRLLGGRLVSDAPSARQGDAAHRPQPGGRLHPAGGQGQALVRHLR